MSIQIAVVKYENVGNQAFVNNHMTDARLYMNQDDNSDRSVDVYYTDPTRPSCNTRVGYIEITASEYYALHADQSKLMQFVKDNYKRILQA